MLLWPVPGEQGKRTPVQSGLHPLLHRPVCRPHHPTPLCRNCEGKAVHLCLQNVRYVDRSPLFLWCSHCLLFLISAYMQNVRYSTTFPVMFSPHLFSTSAYRMFTTSIDHHSSSAVLTISFFHLRLQNIRYVTTSVLCAFAELFSLSHSSISVGRRFGTSPLLCCARLLCCSHFLFLPSPPAERSVRRSPLFLCCS